MSDSPTASAARTTGQASPSAEANEHRAPGSGARLRAIQSWQFQLAAIVVVALIPRLIYLVQIEDWPFFYHPILDSRTQFKWAGILLSTHGLGNPEVLAKAPLYAYFLAFVQWVTAEEEVALLGARLLQLLGGAATCGLTYLLARRVFGQAPALVGGLLLALYSPGVYREGQLLDTAIATLLAVAFLLVLLRALDEPQGRAWFGAGVLLALLGLTRPNMLLLALLSLVLLAAWLWRRLGARRTGRLAAVFLAGVLLPILPITARNYLILGRFTAISSTGGLNFYTGNNPEADGYSPIPSGLAWERTWYEALAAGRETGAEQDAYWWEQALRFWREDTGRALGLLGKKLYLYWNAYEIPNNVSYQWGRQHASVLRVLPVSFAVVGPLGLLGIALGGWRSRARWALTLFVLVQMAAVVIFFVAGRYRMPAAPALCAFAGFAVVEMVRCCREGRWRALAVSLALLAAFAVFVNSDAYDLRLREAANRDWYYLGQSHLLGGDYEQAAEAFERAVAQHPGDADAYRLLGHAEVAAGRPEAARRHLTEALEIAPDYASAAVVLAELYVEQGWPVERAEQLLERAMRLQPRNLRGTVMLVRLNVREGDFGEAKVHFDAARETLTHLNRSDTRVMAVAEELMQVAAEARASGIDLTEPMETEDRSGAAGSGSKRSR